VRALKNPNKYGNISKLPGKRRRPWRVRKTTGWILDETTGKVRQQYLNIGYYKTQAEAIKALADYNANPFSFHNDITFAEVYEKYSKEKFENISSSNVNGYKAAYAVCTSIHNLKFIDIRKAHLQGVVNSSGKNYPTLRKLKVLFKQLYSYARENDICQKDYSEFVNIVKHKEKGDSMKRKPFMESKIKTLWDSVERNDYIQIFLMLIYSGVRIGEMLDLEKCNVHLDERYFDIVDSKTEAGIRKVPIAAKTLPFFSHWMERHDCKNLLCSPDGEPFKYRNYVDAYWKPLIQELGMEHLPHDTRHTTISLLAKANVNQTIIKRIVGHSGAMTITERVYTHFDVQQLIEAIDII